MLKAQLENEKNKVTKPEPNPLTGEVPLRTGVASALLDKKGPKPNVEKQNKSDVKLSKKKSKIEINPDVEMGCVFWVVKRPTKEANYIKRIVSL